MSQLLEFSSLATISTDYSRQEYQRMIYYSFGCNLIKEKIWPNGKRLTLQVIVGIVFNRTISSTEETRSQ